jgi:hypothetical protein
LDLVINLSFKRFSLDPELLVISNRYGRLSCFLLRLCK